MVTYKEIICKSALNRVQHMGFKWSLNPYQGCFHSCVYCFARAHAKLADRDPGQGFSSDLGIKVNVAEVLRKELSSKHWKGESVVIGTATDPYQPIEGKRKLTRSCLEALRDFRNPMSLITKGTLIVRDIDLLVDLAKRAEISISFSVPTLDEEVWTKTEPGTPPPRQRLRALSRLVKAGIEAGIGMAPILPNISDHPKQLEETVKAAKDSGACFVWASTVYLKPGTREHFFEFLGQEYPDLVAKYVELYSGFYPPGRVAKPIAETVGRLRRRYQVYDRRELKLVPPPKPVQLALF